MRRLGPILLGTIPLWLAGAAFAQATPEGAAELQKALNGLYAPAAGPDAPGLFQGAWTVEPAGAAYRLTMPAAASSGTSVMPDGTAIVSESRCESSVGSATPVSDGVYRLRLDAPLDCRFKSSRGPIDVRITARSRVDEFTFDARSKVFSKFASAWEGLTAAPVDGGGPALLTIERITATGDGAPVVQPGHQSIDYHLSAEGLRGRDPGGSIQISVERLGLDGAAKDFDLGGVLAKLAEMMAAQREMASSALKPAPSPEDRQRMAALVGGMYAAYGDTVDGGLSLGGVQVTWPEGSVTLVAADAAFGYGGITGDAGTGRLLVGVEGLAISPPSPYADWIPRDGRIDLAADKIPYQSIFKLWGDAIGRTADPSPQEAKAQAQAVGRALQQAGSSVDVRRYHFAAPQALLDMTGAFQADPQAAHGVTGGAKVRFVGFGPLIKFLQTQPEGAKAVAGFTMIQALGREATDDGRPARDYAISVDAGGKVLINGADIASFMPKRK